MRSSAIAALIVAALPACGDQEACGPSRGMATRVIDGDTIVLADGATVRYVLVDAPEDTSSGHRACHGAEATAFNRALVEGREVELDYDEECHDAYDRLLAYVRVDGRDVSALLVERGHACMFRVPPNGASRVVEFDALEARARSEGRGLWGDCARRPCR
jgi:micrococcal nuclease